ncbi:MAG TPA: HAD hydrolase-like protein [Pyrinomonadaceae bacterium]|jgi:phosphoglycolate phosphatase|nr:HAD hydrolase-like protein [Pyrinomonadaceae bacterium]
MKSDVLLFDLDGTLTDPKPGIIGSIQFALEQLGVSCPGDDILASFIGPPLRGTFATLLDTSDVSRLESAMRLYRERFASSGLYENHVYDGIPAMLEKVRKSDAATFVATSKPAVFAERILQHFELSHHFQKVYGADLDGRFDDKAELIAYLLASEGVSARQAVMIGDRAADVLAAKANGLRSIGVLWGYGSEQELADAGADLILQTPSELSAHLSKAQSN